MAEACTPEEDPLTEDLNCPICLDVLNDPVTLKDCFHSFCKACLQNAIEGARGTYRHPYNCPQCRRRFFPSDADKVNHHLQSIVNSHRKSRERIAEIRQYELQEVGSQSHGDGKIVSSALAPERPSKRELDTLTSFLSAVDGRLQCLLTALDNTSLKTLQPAEAGAESRCDYEEIPENTSQSELIISQNNQSTHETALLVPHEECDFEAETFEEFVDGSVAICRKHFLLIMFVIHACLFVFCLYMAALGP